MKVTWEGEDDVVSPMGGTVPLSCRDTVPLSCRDKWMGTRAQDPGVLCTLA